MQFLPEVTEKETTNSCTINAGMDGQMAYGPKMNLSDSWRRIQIYVPERIRYALRTADFYHEEMTESENMRRLLIWCIENQKDIDYEAVFWAD